MGPRIAPRGKDGLNPKLHSDTPMSANNAGATIIALCWPSLPQAEPHDTCSVARRRDRLTGLTYTTLYKHDTSHGPSHGHVNEITLNDFTRKPVAAQCRRHSCDLATAGKKETSNTKESRHGLRTHTAMPVMI